MKDALVSVIVPVYKVEKYLRQCLDSIVNQTYKNLEIILVDDGSPDNCPQICDEYAKKDKRIKVIHKENGGLSSARNAGLDICTGDYISFIDSDDLVSPRFIEVLYQKCADNDADICECDYVRFHDNDEEIMHETAKTYLINDSAKCSCYDSLDMQLKMYGDNCLQHVVVWNKIYKYFIYENLRFPEGKINEDEYTTYKAFYASKKIAVINASLYGYRYNENSIMGKKFNEKRFDALDSYEEKKEFFYKYNSELYDKTVSRYQFVLKQFFFSTDEYIENNEILIKQLVTRMRKNLKDLKWQNVGRKNMIKFCVLAYMPKFCLLILHLKRKNNM